MKIETIDKIAIFAYFILVLIGALLIGVNIVNSMTKSNATATVKQNPCNQCVSICQELNK